MYNKHDADKRSHLLILLVTSFAQFQLFSSHVLQFSLTSQPLPHRSKFSPQRPAPQHHLYDTPRSTIREAESFLRSR